MGQPGNYLRGNAAGKMTEKRQANLSAVSLLLSAILLISACSRAPIRSQDLPDQTTGAQISSASTETPAPPAATATLFATQTTVPIATQTLEQAATGTQTLTTTTLPAICSPLESIPVENLEGIISNPFAPPSRPGSDDPHQGVDLADIDPATRISLTGRPVQAALAGTVSAVILDRFPYGSAVLIETALDDLPASWQQALAIPTPAPTSFTHPVLTCPTPEFTPEWDSSQRSIYILYAHLEGDPTVTPGEFIQCGQQIGNLGQSGNALNPHLHVEARAGPGGASFASMAHYTGSATQEELRNYCVWRVSAIFQLVDPLRLLLLDP
jgi:murein DD-endopeptidase MepM/ murein hydrolase activator NlpD